MTRAAVTPQTEAPEFWLYWSCFSGFPQHRHRHVLAFSTTSGQVSRAVCQCSGRDLHPHGAALDKPCAPDTSKVSASTVSPPLQGGGPGDQTQRRQVLEAAPVIRRPPHHTEAPSRSSQERGGDFTSYFLANRYLTDRPSKFRFAIVPPPTPWCKIHRTEFSLRSLPTLGPAFRISFTEPQPAPKRPKILYTASSTRISAPAGALPLLAVEAGTTTLSRPPCWRPLSSVINSSRLRTSASRAWIAGSNGSDTVTSYCGWREANTVGPWRATHTTVLPI